MNMRIGAVASALVHMGRPPVTVPARDSRARWCCYQGNSATSPGMRIVKRRAAWYITNGIMTEHPLLPLPIVLCMYLIDAGGEAGPPTSGARCQARRGRQESIGWMVSDQGTPGQRLGYTYG